MLYDSQGFENFTVKGSDKIDDAMRLMEAGFEYRADVEGHKLIRKRK